MNLPPSTSTCSSQSSLSAYSDSKKPAFKRAQSSYKVETPLQATSDSSSSSSKNANHRLLNSAQKVSRAKKYIKLAKELASEGELTRAKQLFEKSYQLVPSQKTLDRIKRLKSVIEENEISDEEINNEENEHISHVPQDVSQAQERPLLKQETSLSKHETPPQHSQQQHHDAAGKELVLSPSLSKKLYAHQFVGVQWMYGLFRDRHKGGILADDMGLGKTIQVISFVSSMMAVNLIKHVLLVVPVSLIPNWCEEFNKWAPQVCILRYCGDSPAAQRRALSDAKRFKSVCITTYGLCQKRTDQLATHLHNKRFQWDYTILDEGHRIKNNTKTTKSLHQIPSKNRIILTGTPVQNKLRDLWALLDWTTQGSLLGSLQSFQACFERPIEDSRQKGSSHMAIAHGLEKAKTLKLITDPYVLRRTKDSLSNATPSKPTADGSREHVSFPKLNKKTDLVVWTYLSDIQIKIYTDFLEMPEVKALLTSHRSPLVHLNILKKICDHPRLLSQKACINLGLMKEQYNEDLESCAANEIDNVDNETLIAESGKLKLLLELLETLKRDGHRTTVFSSSRKMLNIIHKILNDRNFKVMRLDGKVTKMQDRALRVSKFQQDETYNVFLLTIQVGGVGLTLTGADRAIIYDPSWNPSTDNQAVDRIYRIGQEKKVVIYRLITCGTVEEKIYRRQVFKSSIIKQMIDKEDDPYRYFTNMDLKELFKLDDPRESKTQQQLEELHAKQRDWCDEVKQHITRITALDMYGISDNDLMFSQKAEDFDADELPAEHDDKIKQSVAMAANLLRKESAKFVGGGEAYDCRWGSKKEKDQATQQPKPNDANEPVYKIQGIDTTGSLDNWLQKKTVKSDVELQILEEEMITKAKEESLLVESFNNKEESSPSLKVESFNDAEGTSEQVPKEMEKGTTKDDSIVVVESEDEDEVKVNLDTSTRKNESQVEQTSGAEVLAADSINDYNASINVKDRTSILNDSPVVASRKRKNNILDDDDSAAAAKIDLTLDCSQSDGEASASFKDSRKTSSYSRISDLELSSILETVGKSSMMKSQRQQQQRYNLSGDLVNETLLDESDEEYDVSKKLIRSYLPKDSSSSEDEAGDEKTSSPTTTTDAVLPNTSFVARRSIGNKLCSTPQQQLAPKASASFRSSEAGDRTQLASFDFDDDDDDDDDDVIVLESDDDEVVDEKRRGSTSKNSSALTDSIHFSNFNIDSSDDESDFRQSVDKPQVVKQLMESQASHHSGSDDEDIDSFEL